mmetsp:Transcript_26044/g.57544  ORF Transcript_26044/g.57544 Transcript_26044/m.57544 type:complete len:101 (-) Transcript_26044:41-343(-)
MTRSGIAVGINKGHITTKREDKRVNLRGRKSAGKILVKSVITEVAGYAPYERRMMELIKIGSAATFKRCLKFAKKRLGTHKRAKKKRDMMLAVVQASRKK